MSILVIAEHDNQTLKSATLHTVTAATKLGGDVHLLVAGKDCGAAADAAAKIAGVAKVLKADDAALEHQLAENIAPLIVSLAGGYSHILAAATTFGKNLLPRAAALLDTQMISDISEIVSADTFVRPIYAGNALATVQTGEALKILTVRTTGFDAAAEEGGSATVEDVTGATETALTGFVSRELTVSERPELGDARIVVSGGRGLGSKEEFERLIPPLADKLGAAIGASRAAVDAGWVPNDYQVGQTGKQVAPEIYIAVGISGAIQHLAGMKDSKLIIAINKDAEAPIFKIADIGLVGDLQEIMPELMKALDGALGTNGLQKTA
jgi:electron transfer flavoprotein alpha subunit